MKIENTHFRVELSDGLELRFQDLKYGSVWSSDDPFRIVYGHTCAFSLPEHAEWNVTGNGREIHVFFRNLVYWVRFRENQYRKPEHGPDLRFHFTIRLETDHIVFRTECVENLDREDCEVIFPHGLFRFRSSERAQCPLPFGFGALLTFPESAPGGIRYGYSPANMPIFGILRAEHGGIAVYQKDCCDQRTSLEINRRHPGETGFNVEYLFHERIAAYPRELHLYGMRPGADYNEFAKWYRGIVKKEGRFVPLTEKIRRSPDVEKLVGSVIWKHDVYSMRHPPREHSYSYFVMKPEEAVYEKKSANWSAYEIFDKAAEAGFDRVCIYNMGWNRGGFDSMYPTRYPPNPERGSVEEFRAAADYGRSLSPGYIYSVHDNYYECYENSPEFHAEEMAHDSEGRLKRGYLWRGGRSVRLCSDFSLKYARRDLPKIRGMLGKGSIYLDVFGSAPAVSCAHPDHPHGEREDLANRRAVFLYAKELMGSVATEQQPNDFCADIIDLGAFGPISAEPWVSPGIAALPIPLWQLVYHDAVLNYTAESSAYGAYGEEYMAFVALYCMLPTAFDSLNRRISFELRETCLAEMKLHEFLTTPEFDGNRRLHAVARTVFSDGMEVVANFHSEPFFWRGVEIPENSFHLFPGAALDGSAHNSSGKKNLLNDPSR